MVRGGAVPALRVATAPAGSAGQRAPASAATTGGNARIAAVGPGARSPRRFAAPASTRGWVPLTAALSATATATGVATAAGAAVRIGDPVRCGPAARVQVR